MSPRHFANLRKVDPASYKQGEDAVWNTFVTVTHAIGLSNFFSFTPDFYRDHKLDQATGRFAPGEIPGDQDQTP
jgi:hypothetical protein